jgi:hypothetical protein
MLSESGFAEFQDFQNFVFAPYCLKRIKLILRPAGIYPQASCEFFNPENPCSNKISG